MAIDETARDDKIASAIQALFDLREDAYVLLVGGNSVYGCDDISGLRLLVNHLFDEIYQPFRSAERNLIGAGMTQTEQASARRAKLGKALKKLAHASEIDFVVCYHCRGTPQWDMAWSKGLTRDDAVQRMCWLLKDGLENPLELFL